MVAAISSHGQDIDTFGAPLARLEVEIGLGGLLSRFGSMRLAVPAESLRWRPSTLIHGLEALPVRLVPAD